MPFITIVPSVPATKSQKQTIRREIVRLLNAELPECPKSCIRPMFFKDELDVPVDEDDGANTTFIVLHTGLFSKVENPDELAPKITMAIADIVAKSYRYAVEAECFVGELNPKWTSLVEAHSNEE